MTSVRVEDSLDGAGHAFDRAYDAGWTDGLPILPPTRPAVDLMVAASGRASGAVLGTLPPLRAEATVELVAACAVMAGCRPEYFPVVVAGIEAMADPKFELGAINTTTNPVAPMLVVNGPIRHEIALNSTYGVLGPGTRANATIGRAINLTMINVAGRRPGTVSKSTHAQPGRYTMCIAEREEASPWEPFHVENGFAADTSCVTAVAPTSLVNVLDMTSRTADGVLKSLTGSMRITGSINFYPYFGLGPMLLILCPDHANLLAREGLSKADVKVELFERTRDIPIEWLSDELQRDVAASGMMVDDRFVAVAARPEQFDLVVAGGGGGLHSIFVPTFGDSWPVRREIGLDAG